MKVEASGHQKAAVDEKIDPLKLEDEKSIPEAESEDDDGEPAQAKPVRRSQHQTRGRTSRKLDEYDLDYAAGNVAYASEEPINVKGQGMAGRNGRRA